MKQSLEKLNLQDKQTIIDLLFDVQIGDISCRRAATELQKQVPKRRLTIRQRKEILKLRYQGSRVKDLAIWFNVNPTTIWRITKKS